MRTLRRIEALALSPAAQRNAANIGLCIIVGAYVLSQALRGLVVA